MCFPLAAFQTKNIDEMKETANLIIYLIYDIEYHFLGLCRYLFKIGLPMILVSVANTD